MMGGPGVGFFVLGGSLTLVAFFVFCFYHIVRSPKGRRIEAIFFDCLIGLIVWATAFAVVLEFAAKHDYSDFSGKALPFATPWVLFLSSIFFSRRRW